MRVTDVMQTNLRTIRGTDTVGEAIALLAESHVSGVPVVDDHGRLVGVLSNSDILEALAEHTDPEAREAVFEQTVVQEVMTPRPQTINPEATIRDAAQLMMIVTGEAKAGALLCALEGAVSPTCPASILQTHANVLVLADEAAASLLRKTPKCRIAA